MTCRSRAFSSPRTRRTSRRRSAWLISPAVVVSALAFTACGGSSNDASISGKISDSAGQALPVAVVVIGNGQIRTATVVKHDGTYSFDDQPTGNTPVHVFAPGFVYDPGHNLKSLNAGTNSYDVRLNPQPSDKGPRFTADPTVTRQGSELNLKAPIQAGPGSPIGDELLAVDVTDHFAVLMTNGGSGNATGSVAGNKVSANAGWVFIATDNACQESPTFPFATTPS
ncbi:MAG: carboxypeptidase-like regulatory domain-containing protein [Candidatus Dormibacteria bacterium]